MLISYYHVEPEGLEGKLSFKPLLDGSSYTTLIEQVVSSHFSFEKIGSTLALRIITEALVSVDWLFDAQNYGINSFLNVIVF